MADPYLTRAQIATYRNKAVNDPTQVPTAATVEFYRIGATVSLDVTIPAHLRRLVQVYDSTTLTVGDVVTIGADGPSLTVTAISGPTTIELENGTAASITITAGTRLRRSGAQPRLYASRGGPALAGSAITTDAITGRAMVYVEADRFDYTVAVTHQPKRIVADASGGVFRDDITRNDVRDFPGIQAAIDALPASGGVVYIPEGSYELSGVGLQINRDSVTLRGEGLGTVIQGRSGSQFDLITVNAGHCKISDLHLDYPHAVPANSCLLIQGGGSSCHLENLLLTGEAYGMRVTNAFNTLAVNCEFYGNPAGGVRLDAGVNGVRFLNCIMTSNGGPGVLAYDAVGVSLYGCDLEANTGGAGVDQGNALEAHNCERIEVYSCSFEDALTGTNRAEQFILLDGCRGAIVDSCFFQGNAETPTYFQPNRAVRFKASPWSRLSNNAAENMKSELAWFDTGSDESIEFGNRDASGPIVLPNFKFATDPPVRVLGLSRRALGLYTHASNFTRPASQDLREGSLIWNKDPHIATGNRLQVWDGSVWKSVALGP